MRLPPKACRESIMPLRTTKVAKKQSRKVRATMNTLVRSRDLRVRPTMAV